jgi:hypothetical protein
MVLSVRGLHLRQALGHVIARLDTHFVQKRHRAQRPNDPDSVSNRPAVVSRNSKVDEIFNNNSSALPPIASI